MDPDRNIESITFAASPYLKALITRHARKMQVSTSAFVRMAVMAYVEKINSDREKRPHP